MMKKVISVMAIVAGVVALLYAVAPIVVSAVLAVPAASSVGIIGGADGPTAIMVSGALNTNGIIAAVAVGVLLVIAGILVLKKAKKTD